MKDKYEIDESTLATDEFYKNMKESYELLVANAVTIRRQAVESLLKKFPIESLHHFRYEGGECYTHAESGVGYLIKQEYDETGISYVAIPGIYHPKPLPPKD